MPSLNYTSAFGRRGAAPLRRKTTRRRAHLRQASEYARITVTTGRARDMFQPMSPDVEEILRHVDSWPKEDQEELAEVAREIEARRSGVYRATPDELRALDEAARSGIASKDEVEAAFRSFRRP